MQYAYHNLWIVCLLWWRSVDGTLIGFSHMTHIIKPENALHAFKKVWATAHNYARTQDDDGNVVPGGEHIRDKMTVNGYVLQLSEFDAIDR